VKHVARFVITCLLPLAALSGCFSDDLDDGDSSRRNDGGVPADMADAAISPACPESPPRIGERCPSVEEHGTRCSYVVNQCSYNGNVYDKTNDICCSPGGNWYECGTNETPCDREPPTDAGL
jgi:hypothetical protein